MNANQRQRFHDGVLAAARNYTSFKGEGVFVCWAEARLKIARMTLTIKLDGNWSSFQLANSAPPLSVTDSALAPSARMVELLCCTMHCHTLQQLMLLGVSWRDDESTVTTQMAAPSLSCRLKHASCGDLGHHRRMLYETYGGVARSILRCRLYLHRITITVIFLCSRNKSDLPF